MVVTRDGTVVYGVPRDIKINDYINKDLISGESGNGNITCWV